MTSIDYEILIKLSDYHMPHYEISQLALRYPSDADEPLKLLPQFECLMTSSQIYYFVRLVILHTLPMVIFTNLLVSSQAVQER